LESISVVVPVKMNKKLKYIYLLISIKKPIKPKLAPKAFTVPDYSQKGHFSQNLIWQLNVRVFQNTEQYF
jgi:hypothetical protein